MKLKFQTNAIICTREEKDPKFFGIQNAKGESNFLYFVKNILNKMIENKEDMGIFSKLILSTFVKKRMYKDGHLVDDMQQYLRSAKPFIYNGKKGVLALYNGHWAINGLDEDWNKGEACLELSFLESNTE